MIHKLILHTVVTLIGQSFHLLQVEKGAVIKIEPSKSIMLTKAFVAVAVLCIFTIAACFDDDEHKFTLWIDHNHIGLKADFYGEEGSDKCYNLPYYMNDEATSINTRGGCVALYQHANCHGRKVIFKMNCTTDRCCPHNNFVACNFNDQASSYEMC